MIDMITSALGVNPVLSSHLCAVGIDYWFDMYLKARTPLPLNYNPFIAFVDDTNPGGDNQVINMLVLLTTLYHLPVFSCVCFSCVYCKLFSCVYSKLLPQWNVN